MTLVRRFARPLLAAPFIANGLDGLRHPGPRVEAARPLVARFSDVASPLGVPNDPELLVRVNGAAMTGAGALLATGNLPRLAGLVLAVTSTASTVSNYPFWAEKDPETRRTQRREFLARVGLVGGALLAAVDTEGRPGLAWRGRKAAKTAEKTAARASREAKRATRLAKAEARVEGARLKRKAKELVPS